MRRPEPARLAHEPRLCSSEATSGRYRDLDLARPGVVLVHRAGVKGLDSDTVVIADVESDSASDPTAATLRMAYYVMITCAPERLVRAGRGVGCRGLWRGRTGRRTCADRATETTDMC